MGRKREFIDLKPGELREMPEGSKEFRWPWQYANNIKRRGGYEVEIIREEGKVFFKRSNNGKA